jgi:hypothetical protein
MSHRSTSSGEFLVLLSSYTNINLPRLIALFELAGVEAFDCSQIVACVKRSQHTNEMELVRSLGWCGFNLTTLEPWSTAGDSGPFVSPKWLFLAAEV